MSTDRTDERAADVTAALATRPYRISAPIVLSEADLAARGGVLPVWADPLALADETEADRLRERRLYVGLAVAILLVTALFVLRTVVLA